MKDYFGGCHCGSVRFRISADLSRVIECNCSICSKKGSLMVRVAPQQFELLCGESVLQAYRFGTRRAAHHFCRDCGIHPFLNPRAAPEAYTVNVRCLDEFPLCIKDSQIVPFDGQHWEEAVASFRFEK